MKVGKPTSKRVTVRLRHKIQKSSAAKQKKQRRDDKKNPQWRSRLKKDPGIPNLFPYKAKVLVEIEESKRRKEEEQMRKKEEAKARRQGLAVADVPIAASIAHASAGDEMVDDDDDEVVDEDMEDGGSNPMAALLASAQARAQSFGNDEDEDDEDDEEDEADEWGGIQDKRAVDPVPAKKGLPQQALDDPIKAISKLMERMQQTQDGIQRLIEYYQAPPLSTGGTSTDVATKFLVEVARKRGRLGRGGVPNLHSSAMLVLNDLNEERLKLPALPTANKQAKKVPAGSKGEVKIVQTMAEPFKLEGLWGEEKPKADLGQEMAVET